MAGLDFESMKAMLDEFSGGADPDGPRERKRLLIVEKASELFAQQGFRKTSVDQIAERAGVAKGSVYLHFKSKPEILLQATVEEKKRNLERFRDILEPGLAPRERLRRWVRALLTAGQDLPLTSRMLGGDREMMTVLYQLGADRGEDWHAMQIALLGQIVDEAVRPHAWTEGEIADRARVLFGLAFFGAQLPDERIRGGLALERYAEILADMIVDGIGPSPKGGDR